MDQDLQARESPSHDRQQVPDHRARRRGDDADLPGEERERPLAVGLEEPLGLQPGLQLIKRELERPDPLGLHELDVDLILPATLVNRERPADEDGQTVRRLEPEQPIVSAKHHPPDLSLGVLQREIHMPGGVVLEIRQLPFRPEGGKAVLQDGFHLGG